MVLLVSAGAVYGPVVLGPGLLVMQWGHFQRVRQALVRILSGVGGKVGDGEAEV